MTGSGKSTDKTPLFSVLHDSDTGIGRVMLRRRWSPALERHVFEMTVEGKLMMSDAFVDSERALAERALALLPGGSLRLLIGGLGFGFTARAALADSRVSEVTVVERLEAVLDWHRSGLLPWSRELTSDPRVTLLQGDFFARVKAGADSRYDAVLIDIDDAPNLLWHESHAAFYESTGLVAIRDHVAPGGVLGLWCAVRPGAEFLDTARATFATAELVEVPFENPCLRQTDTNYVLLATTSGGES